MTHIQAKPLAASMLKLLEAELAGYYGALAVLANECFQEGAGDRMLGTSDADGGCYAERVDIRATHIGRMLPAYAAYAYEGVQLAGFSPDSLERMDGPFAHLRDMLGTLDARDAYFEDCLIGAGASVEEIGHLQRMVDLVLARASLDQGQPLTIPQLALLAGMNERSVRNATAGADAQLTLNTDGTASNIEALRWLEGRRSFRRTVVRAVGIGTEAVPESLEGFEIPYFVRRRLRALWDDGDQSGHVGDWELKASAAAGLPLARLEAATELPLRIQPVDCPGLARAMKVDLAWFTHQVMSALFPEQVDMLLNPGHWRSPDLLTELPVEPGTHESISMQNAAAAAAVAAAAQVDVVLSPSMIKHGYLDMPASAKSMFPADCLGARSPSDNPADIGEVELRYGTHRAMTYIREKSERTISPRARFGAWFNRELSARPGQVIRVTRIADRVYQLACLAI